MRPHVRRSLLEHLIIFLYNAMVKDGNGKYFWKKEKFHQNVKIKEFYTSFYFANSNNKDLCFLFHLSAAIKFSGKNNIEKVWNNMGNEIAWKIRWMTIAPLSSLLPFTFENWIFKPFETHSWIYVCRKLGSACRHFKKDFLLSQR